MKPVKITLRRSSALVATALVLSASALSSCGFNPATNQINTISAGVNDRAGDIDILGAVIVGNADNSGVFIATFVNNMLGPDETVTLTDLSGSDLHSVRVSGSLPTITVDPAKAVVLTTDDLEIPVTGSFQAGDFVGVTLTFDSGQTSTLTIPVVLPCDAYAGITPTALPSSSPSSTSTSATTPTSSTTDDPYSCAAQEPNPVTGPPETLNP